VEREQYVIASTELGTAAVSMEAVAQINIDGVTSS